MISLTPLWPERYRRHWGETPLVQRSTLQREAAAWTAAIAHGQPGPETLALPHTTPGWYSTATTLPVNPDKLDVFAQLPSVRAALAQVAAVYEGVGQDPATPLGVALHAAYQLMCWDACDRRTYLLDRALVEQLLASDVPAWPLTDLHIPVPSAYFVLPAGCAQVRVQGDPVPQPLEGVFCTIPTAPAGVPREMHLFVTAKSPHDAGDDNVLFHSIGLGPDTRLCDVVGPHVEPPPLEGLVTLGTLPALLLSVLLYLNAEHPDVRFVPAEPQEPVAALQNAAKRRKVEQRNARRSRLGVHYVGGQHRLETLAVASYKPRTAVRTFVRGHWRQQAYGTAWQHHRPVWIHPHWRVEDAAPAQQAVHVLR